MENGIYTDIPAATYHAMAERVSNSYLSRLAICPAAAKVLFEPTPAMLLGTALHSFVLDGPVEFAREYVVIPGDAPRRPTAAQINAKKPSEETQASVKWWDNFTETSKGKAIITADDLTAIMAMDASIKAHPTASRLIGSGTNEVSVLWTDPFSGLDCKARVDKVPGDVKRTLIDLKSTADASPHGFQKSVASFGYHRQGAIYLDGMNKATEGGYDLFVFVAVEKSPPYRVGVYTLSPIFIDRGRTEYQMLLTLEMRCREKNAWPHYTDAGVTEIEMPKWMSYQEG